MGTLDFTPLALWGCGGQSKVLRELIAGTDHKVIVTFSDNQEEGAVAGDENVRQWVSEQPFPVDFAVAIGGQYGRERLAKIGFLKSLGLKPATLIHRTSTILSRSYGEACQILSRSILGVEASLGDGVILNTGASVDHECRIGDGVHIGPGSVLAGRVTVGARTFIGANSTILPDLTIAEDCIIGAGSVVTKDITVPGVYVGSPARLSQKCT